jgi:hypothetical protein
MSVELEIAGAASAGGLTTRQSADLSGEPCRNCGGPVDEKYCPKCGQLAASFHRPIWSLMGETIADTFTLDGRLAKTVPVLLLRPGRLTKSYTEGKRARYVPPFRMFLLASLLFYLMLFTVVTPGQWLNSIDDETRADIETSLAETPEIPDLDEETRARLERANISVDAPEEIRGDIENQIVAVLNRPDQFAAEIEKWLPRLSILMVPLTIVALVLLHIWRRSLYVYDHAVHALHLHSWIYLTGAFMMFAGPVLPGFVFWLYGISFLIYLWRSLVVAGSSGFFMSGLRTFLILFFWTNVTATIVFATIIVSGMSVQA